jgi:enamine deaminase RidA (YjgF/YER057c/UK114 family)
VIKQSEQALDNLGAVLQSAGARVRRRYFGGARPASTLIEVSALAHTGAVVAIEAVALLDRRDGFEA